MKSLTFEQICRRAGGRRRYNKERQEAAAVRRADVFRLMREYGGGRGTQARIARELGVSEATVSRDVRDARLVEWLMKNPAEAIRLLWK